MKNVLVVDDETSLIESMKVGFETFKDSFSVLTARNGRESIAVLESTPIDLVVTDLRMPEIDGIELLAYMNSNFPSIPAIVMSAFGTPEIEEKLKAMGGVIKFMDKPVEFDDLAQSIVEGLKYETPGGSLSGISVGSFLQLVEMERKTCLLDVHSDDGEKGLFYFNQGALCDAIFGNLKGEEAFYEIIRLDNVQISFKNLPKKKLMVKKRIKTPLMSLLMEGARLKDEAAAEKEVVSVVEDLKAVDEGGDEKNNENAVFSLEKDTEELAEKEEKTISSEGGNQMAGLKEILKEMAGEMDGVIALGVIGMDGITVATHNPTGADMDAISAKFAMLMKLGEKATNDIKTMGDFEENLVQAKNAWILTRFLSKDYYVALAVSREGTLGNVRLVAQKYTDQLNRAI